MDLNLIFIKNDEIFVEKNNEDFMIILGDGEEEKIVYLSDVSAEIFDLCNGERTVMELIDCILEMYDVSRIECENDTFSCLNELLELEIIKVI